MAKRRLTLILDEEVMAQAKRLAARQKVSLSTMFARFVQTPNRAELSTMGVPKDSLAARMRGIARLPKGKSERDVLTEALCDKFKIKR